MSSKNFIIKHVDGFGYWSNLDGYVGNTSDATIFSEEEAVGLNKVRLPLSGMWIVLNESNRRKRTKAHRVR